MSFRIRTVEVTAQGREIVRNRDLAADRLSLGRAADSDLHLPDLTLDPRHAEIALLGDGRVQIEASGALGFLLDGRRVTSATIDPASGSELRFGSYRVAISRDSDGIALLTVGEVASGDAPHEEKSVFSLGGRFGGKRLASWLLFAAVLIGFLVVPIYSVLHRAPKETVRGDAAWNSGPLSQAHHQLEGMCESCHVKPFEPVQDTTCLTCHKDIADHAKPARIADARAPGSMGERLQWEVGHALGKPGPGACSDCHTEHEGAGPLPPPRQAFCADCHGDLKDRLADTRLGNASDFGKQHPQFAPVVPLALGSDKLTRVSLDARPREASGLTFPHDLHLNARGGVAQMARRLGQGQQLGCASCHVPTADGVRFLPIDMERDCMACHSLTYDKVGPTFRKLRHGDVDQMVADLSVSRGPSSPIVVGRRRPGEYANGGSYFARFTPPAASIGSAAQALSRDGICGECHTPAASGGRFSVMPVTQVSRYMQHGWFTHAAHKQEKCTSCHTADRSGTSADLLLPNVNSCRTCHLGEDAPRGKVPSGCAMCHSYHIGDSAPRGLVPRRRE
jgi:Cytochrome c3